MRIEQNEYKRSKGIWYWISTALLAFILFSGGLWLMTGNQPMDAYLGFPAYFWQILGFCKILGGIAILVPRFPLLKEWAYAGIVFNLTGAAAARASVGDSTAHIIAPLVICGIAIASWFLRPESRKIVAERIGEIENDHSLTVR
ncbi:MAG: DoxX family protein [Chitinophagaceae bacterium]|nr:DoxX family protein [Chitinophagaceae bacterium]